MVEPESKHGCILEMPNIKCNNWDTLGEWSKKKRKALKN
jgi:hypothetical protein